MSCIVVKDNHLRKFPLAEPKSFQPAGLPVWMWGGRWGECSEHKVSTQVRGLHTYHCGVHRECAAALFVLLLFKKGLKWGFKDVKICKKLALLEYKLTNTRDATRPSTNRTNSHWTHRSEFKELN